MVVRTPSPNLQTRHSVISGRGQPNIPSPSLGNARSPAPGSRGHSLMGGWSVCLGAGRPDAGLPKGLAVAPSSPCAPPPPPPSSQTSREKSVSDVVFPYREPGACQIGHPNQG